MLFLISLVLVVCFVCFCDKSLKKHSSVFYIASSIVTITVIAVSQTEFIRSIPEFFRTYIIGIFSKGSFAAALWCVVMWAGAFPNGSVPIKKIMPIRGELSICAAAVTLSHIVTYGITYIKTLTNNIKLDREPTTEFILTCIISVILILIMLPLTIMSFKKIRKKMNASIWKKIQRSAYLFYALTYVHIMILYIPQAQRGMTDKYISIIVYSIVFIGYAAMRIRKAAAKKNPEKFSMISTVCVISAVLLFAVLAVLSCKKTSQVKQPVINRNNSETVTTSVVSTAEIIQETTSVSSVTSFQITETATSISGTGTTDISSGSSSSTSVSVTDYDDDNEETIDNSSETETTPVEENENPVEEQTEPENSEPESVTDPPEESEPVYIYNNGTYTGTAYGYAGDITVTITIENDVITNISAAADGDDPEYYDYAMDYILPQIQQNTSADVDVYAGATYSSQGLIDAARQALSQAVR